MKDVGHHGAGTDGPSRFGVCTDAIHRLSLSRTSKATAKISVGTVVTPCDRDVSVSATRRVMAVHRSPAVTERGTRSPTAIALKRPGVRVVRSLFGSSCVHREPGRFCCRVGCHLPQNARAPLNVAAALWWAGRPVGAAVNVNAVSTERRVADVPASSFVSKNEIDANMNE